jgi:hypothetical protein
VKLPFITKESCPEFYFAKGGTSTGTTWYRQFPNTATTCSDSMTKVLVINDL